MLFKLSRDENVRRSGWNQIYFTKWPYFQILKNNYFHWTLKILQIQVLYYSKKYNYSHYISEKDKQQTCKNQWIVLF